MMTPDEQLRLLKSVAPLECEVAGDAAVEHLLANGAFGETEGGRDLSGIDAINLLAAILTIGMTARETLVYFVRKHSRVPSPEDLAGDLETRIAARRTASSVVVDEEYLQDICTFVIDCYRRDNE